LFIRNEKVYNIRSLFKIKKLSCNTDEFKSLCQAKRNNLFQVGDREAFRRAFAAATVHDMFNWLTVVVMLILETTTGFLEWMTEFMVEHMPINANVSNPDLLKPLTGPLTDRIVQVNKLDQLRKQKFFYFCNAKERV
jgi:hypothetical protein